MMMPTGKRMVKLPSLSDQTISIKGPGDLPSPPFTDFFYILFTGCAVSATLG
jgi:hypothetical protein